jgi:hypothetical protein
MNGKVGGLGSFLVGDTFSFYLVILGLELYKLCFPSYSITVSRSRWMAGVFNMHRKIRNIFNFDGIR